MTDPYKILGVPYDVGESELKAAYHALARRYHPDNFARDPARLEMAGRKMRDINAAYEQITRDRAAGIDGAAAYGKRKSPSKERGASRDEGRGAGDAPPRYRERADESPRAFAGYDYIRRLLEGGNYAAALGELYRVGEKLRTAEWHFLAGCAHRGMHHLHDALREVSVACRMEPHNQEYRRKRDEMRGKAGRPREEYEGRRKRSADVKVEGKPDRDPCRQCCFCFLGMGDGKC